MTFLPQAADADPIAATTVTNPVIASFTQHVYEDATVGAAMPYNIDAIREWMFAQKK